jgi:excisionase family DNA binding protein
VNRFCIVDKAILSASTLGATVHVFILLSMNYLSLNALIDEYPNVIFQLSGRDLKAFAEEILLGAKSIAMFEAEAAAKADVLITLDEASKLLHVSKMTLYRWDKSGVLKKVEIGGKRRYRKSDIERIVGTRL